MRKLRRNKASNFTVGYRIVILNTFGISIIQEKSMRNGLAIHLNFLPLQLFIGFNIANRWYL